MRKEIRSLQHHHVRAAAREIDLKPWESNSSTTHRVEIDGKWYPPRSLLRKAWELAGFPADRTQRPQQLDGNTRVWREHLTSLGFRIEQGGVGRPIVPRTEGVMATADDLTADAVRSAAAAWDAKDFAFKQTHASTGYDVWIDGEPYPPKAIGVLAAEALGLAPPTGYGYGTINGPWYPKLDELGFSIRPKGESPDGEGHRDSRTASDVEAVQSDSSLDATTKRRLVDARLGQGRFRSRLEDHWDAGCAVTGIQVRAVLRASHIEPWAKSDNTARLDPHNGLLLVANLDCLFDRGLISFGDNGALLIGATLQGAPAEALGLSNLVGLRNGGSLHLTNERRQYLARHRAAHGFQVHS
ncbi:HNH endonuclease [Cupriavidus basilensis]